jgi:hypothetical protein
MKIPHLHPLQKLLLITTCLCFFLVFINQTTHHTALLPAIYITLHSLELTVIGLFLICLTLGVEVWRLRKKLKQLISPSNPDQS